MRAFFSGSCFGADEPETGILAAFALHFPQIESIGSRPARQADFALRQRFSEKWKVGLTSKVVPGYSDLESQLYMAPTITNRVKELRIAQGWTQEQLAQAAGVSRQSINSIERNRYVPTWSWRSPSPASFPVPPTRSFNWRDHHDPSRPQPHSDRSITLSTKVFASINAAPLAPRPSSASLTLFALLEYRLLVEHRVPWDLISVIYAMGATKIVLMLWYRFKN